jgi:DNA-binding beta-propeller fold protein YncE
VLGQYIYNGLASLAEPVHGFGSVTVTTAGGTSVALSLNELQTSLSYLRDVAFDKTNSSLWVVDNDPAMISRIDAASGQVLQSIALTDEAFGSTSFFGGLQVAPQALTLNGVSVAAGSLLLFNGQTYFDRITAVDPASGAAIATLLLDQNYDLTGGVFDPASGHLFVTQRNVGPNRIAEIDPATGAQLSSFVAPFNAAEAGLAIDPVTGNLWYGSYESTEVVELTTAGVEIRRVDLALQGVGINQIAGLAFDAQGKLLIAAHQHNAVYRAAV